MKRIDSWLGVSVTCVFGDVDLFRTTLRKEGTRASRSSGRNNLPVDLLAPSLSVLFDSLSSLDGWESFRETRELDLDRIVLLLVRSLY